MEKNAGSNMLDQERLGNWLELELAMVRCELEDSRAVQEKMEFVLQIERAKSKQLEEKHSKNKVMKEKLIKKIAQIEKSALKVVSCDKQSTMNSDFWELLECEKTRGEVTQCQLLVELADTKNKLAALEASLEVKTRLCFDLEQEKVCMQRDLLILEKSVQKSKNLFYQSEHGMHIMKCALDNTEQDVLTISQKQQEAVLASEVLDKTIKAQETSLQLMEIENAKLKDVVNEQASRFSELQKEIEKATFTNKDLTQHLCRAVQKQTLLYIYAHEQLREKGALLLNERQKASSAEAQQEALQERSEYMQKEGMLLSQHLDVANQKAAAKEQEVMQERLKTIHSENKILALQERLEKVENESTLLSQQLEAASKKAEAKEQEVMQERLKTTHTKNEVLVIQEKLEKVENESTLLSQQLEAASKKAEAKEQEVMQERLKTTHTKNEVLVIQEKLEKVENESTLLSQQLEAASKKAEAKEQEVMQERLKTTHTKNEVLVIQDKLEKVENESTLLSQKLEAANKKVGAKEQEVMQEHLKTVHSDNETLALQERLEKVENESTLLSQQLEAANKKAEAKEQEVMQERLKTTHTENEVLVIQERLKKVENESTLLSQQLEAANKKVGAKEQEVMQEHLKTVHSDNEILALQERLEKVENEYTLLSQQLEAANKKAEAKEQEVIQERLKTMHTENEVLALQEKLEKVENESTLLSQQLEAANKKAEAKEQEVMQERLKRTHTENGVLVIQEGLKKVENESTLLSEQLEMVNKKVGAKEQEVIQERLKTMHSENEVLALKERLEKVESESTLLRQQLEAANQKAEAKEQEHSRTMLTRNDMLALQNRLEKVVDEGMLLSHQLDTANKIVEERNQEVADMHERLKTMYTENEMLALQEKLEKEQSKRTLLSQELEAANQKAAVNEQEVIQDLKTSHSEKEILYLQERLEKVESAGMILNQQLEAACKKAEEKELEVMEEHMRTVHVENEMLDLQERLGEVENEGMILRQQLEAANQKTEAKEPGARQQHLKMIQAESKIFALQETLENVDTLVSQQLESVSKTAEAKEAEVADMQDHLKAMHSQKEVEETSEDKLAPVRKGGPSTLWKLQKHVGDTQTKLTTFQGLLEMHAIHCSDLMEQNISMEQDMSRLKRLLRKNEDSCTKSESFICELIAGLNKKDNEIITGPQKLLVSSVSWDKEPVHQMTEIQEQPHWDDTDRWDMVWQLQQKLADAKINLLTCKASLKVNTNHCRDLEEEKESMQKDMTALKRTLREMEDMYAKSEQHVHNLMAFCDEKDYRICTLSEQVQVSSASKSMKMSASKKAEVLNGEEKGGQNPWWQQQKELAATKIELPVHEASLKVKAKHCRNLDEETRSMTEVINALKGKLWELEDKCAQSEQHVCYLTGSCEEKDHQIHSLFEKLHATSHSSGKGLKNTENQVHLDSDETNVQNTVWQIQQELADAKMKLLTCEASLKVSAKYCRDLLEEKQFMQKDMNTLNGRLWESVDKCAQSEELAHSMVTSCTEKDHQICALSKQLEVLTALKGKMSKKAKIQDSEEIDRQNMVWQQLQELVDTKTKLAACEASLKFKAEHCIDLEEENQSMQQDIVNFKERLLEREDKCMQLEQGLQNITNEDEDYQNHLLSKKLHAPSGTKSKKPDLKDTEIQEHLDSEETERWNTLWQLQNEHADTKAKLLTCEAALKMNTDHIRDLEEENQSMQRDAVTLRGRLQESKDAYAQLEQHICNLMSSCDDKNNQICALERELQVLSASKSKKSKKVKNQDTEETHKQNMMQLQRELADTKTKLATYEASLKVNAEHCRDLEKETHSMQKDIVTLKEKLHETEQMHAQLEQLICTLIASCDDKDLQSCTLWKKLQVLSASVGTDRPFERAEESKKINWQKIHMTEQQTSKVAVQQTEVEPTRVKKDLEELNHQMKEQIPLNTDDQMKERIAALEEEKEKAILQQETLEKQQEGTQNEKKVLHQQFKEAQMKAVTKEMAGTDVEHDRLTKTQALHEKGKEFAKRSKELAGRHVVLHEHSGNDKTDREHNWRQVKRDMVNLPFKALAENVSLEVISHHCSNLENQERGNMELDLESLNEMIKDCENILYV